MQLAGREHVSATPRPPRFSTFAHLPSPPITSTPTSHPSSKSRPPSSHPDSVSPPPRSPPRAPYSPASAGLAHRSCPASAVFFRRPRTKPVVCSPVPTWVVHHEFALVQHSNPECISLTMQTSIGAMVAVPSCLPYRRRVLSILLPTPGGYSLQLPFRRRLFFISMSTSIWLDILRRPTRSLMDRRTST